MIPQLEALLREHEPNHPEGFSFIKLHNGSSHRNPKVSFVAFAGRSPLLFLKTVRLPENNQVIEHAHACLQAANAWISSHQLPVILPNTLWMTNVDRFTVSAESLVPGRALDTQSPAECLLALNLLRAWNKTGKSQVNKLDHKTLVDTWIHDMQIKSAPLIEKINATYKTVATSAKDIPSIPQHGDTTQSNFLMGEGKLGLIDWDRFGDIQVPLFDAFTFIERITPKKENPVRTHQAFIDELLQVLDLDKNTLPLLVFLFALGTEWRKRLRFHPFEVERLDEQFTQNLDKAMHWLE